MIRKWYKQTQRARECSRGLNILKTRNNDVKIHSDTKANNLKMEKMPKNGIFYTQLFVFLRRFTQ